MHGLPMWLLWSRRIIAFKLYFAQTANASIQLILPIHPLMFYSSTDFDE